MPIAVIFGRGGSSRSALRQLACALNNATHLAVVHCLLGVEPVIAPGVASELVNRLIGGLREDAPQSFSRRQGLLCLDLDIRDLA